MKRKSEEQAGQEKKEVRMELKYCERCGGLWLRECGAGVVYCDRCQPKVDDLPIPKKKPERVILPVRRPTVVDDFEFDAGDEDDNKFEDIDFDDIEFDAMGGVA
jgi:hypothetical protein